MKTRWTIGTVTASGILAALLWNGSQASGEEPAPPPPQNPQGTIEDIDRKIEELERQKQALHRQAEEMEQLSDLQNHARERQEQITGELAEVRAAEKTESQAVNAHRQARIQYLEAQTKAMADVLTVKQIADLPKARELRSQIEDRDIEWDILLGPRHELAVVLEEMERQAAGEEGTAAQRALLERIRVLYKENTTAREAQFQAAKACMTSARQMEKLVDQFHSGH